MSTEAAKSSQDTSYYIYSAIGIIIMFGFGYLPVIEPLTELGMKIVGIFMGAIFLWSTVGLLWPSLLGILAMGLSGYAPLGQIFAQSFADPVAIIILFAMTLFGAIQHHKVPHYISRWFLTRKIINGKPVLFTFIFLTTSFILTVVGGSAMASLLFMWAMLYDLLKDVGYAKEDGYTAAMVMGVVFTVLAGLSMKPLIGGPPLMMAAAYNKVADTTLNYAAYMAYGFIMWTLAIALYCLVMKYVLRIDMSKIAGINIDYFNKNPLPPFNAHQKCMFVALISFLILVYLPSALPETFPFVLTLKKLGAAGISIAFIVIFTLFKIDGKPIISVTDIMHKYVSWDMYFLVSMAMLIAGALTKPVTGFSEFLTEFVGPLLGGHSAMMFTIIIVFLSLFITQFANNGITGVLLMPVLAIFAQESGANFQAIATLFIFCMHPAVMTAAGSPYAAMALGNTEWIDRGNVFKYGFIFLVMFAALFIVVGIPLVNLMCSN